MKSRQFALIVSLSLFTGFADPILAADPVSFDLRSVRDGDWSNPRTWEPARLPKQGDRVLVAKGTTVTFDHVERDVIRLLHVAGTLRFARDRDTELNVGVLKVQPGSICSESGFACDIDEMVNEQGEPILQPPGGVAHLEVGTPEEPIPAEFTAKIRLHFLDDMNKDDAPALVCCSGQMDLHGAPMSRTWMKLGQDVGKGSRTVELAEPVTGWRVGDEVIVTGSERQYPGRTYRNNPEATTTEERTISRIEGKTITLDRPLEHAHAGEGKFRSEVANLSRNVIVESADPKGVRGHTMYHRFSQGSISYARFAHLGKEGVLGRYAIHYHLLGDSMRGSSLIGAAIIDSHNRWVTIHGTEYMVVRDCVGYQSVGHGYFMEDGTEVYNLLDRNLGVQAYQGRRLPNQVLRFDPNDGAGFWWANGRNTLVRNVACENDEYGYRYDMQHSRYFDSTLPIRQPDGSRKYVDVRTIPIWRFEANEAHTEGLYGMVVAANGGNQPDSPIRSRKALERYRQIDWTGPDTRHPHMIHDLKLWEVHYAIRPHSPAMWMEDIHIDHATYGVYRPAFEDHVYRNVTISHTSGEPFNRAGDDSSAQTGAITVDGLTFDGCRSTQHSPLIQISDNDLTGNAATHIRGLRVINSPRPDTTINRGTGPRPECITGKGVPIFVHDYFGPGRHAKVVSTESPDALNDGNQYREVEGLTGDESRAAEVTDVEFPTLLDPVDDQPPATIILAAQREGSQVRVRGVTHDNGEITRVTVNGQPARFIASGPGVVDWEIEIPRPKDGKVRAGAEDRAGNREQTPHEQEVR